MKPNIEELRKKYMANPPEGMTSRDIRDMSEDELQTAPQTGRFCIAKRTRSGASGHLNLMI